MAEICEHGTSFERTATIQNARLLETAFVRVVMARLKRLAHPIVSATGQSYWQAKMLRSRARRQILIALQEKHDVVPLNQAYLLPVAKSFIKRLMPLFVNTHNYNSGCFCQVGHSAAVILSN
jgi:hypothetical protein